MKYNVLKKDFKYVKGALSQSLISPLDDKEMHGIVSTWMNLFKDCESITLDSCVHPQRFLINLGFISVSGSDVVYRYDYIYGQKLYALITYQDTQSVITLKVQRVGSRVLEPVFRVKDKAKYQREHGAAICITPITDLLTLVDFVPKREYMNRINLQFKELIGENHFPFVVDVTRLDVEKFLQGLGFRYLDKYVSESGAAQGSCWANDQHTIYMLNVSFDEGKVLLAYNSRRK